MSGAIRAISQNGLRARRCARGMLEDCRAIAATEFAVIAPVMLVLFFGTVEFSLAVAVDRKVTLMARTLSDLTSQSPPAGIFDADFTNIFAAANGVMTPYTPPLYPAVSSTITEIYIDPATGVGRSQWSKGSAAFSRLASLRRDFHQAAARRKSFSRRREDCQPKTCQSGDPPRSRRRSSGLHAAFQVRHARRR